MLLLLVLALSDHFTNKKQENFNFSNKNSCSLSTARHIETQQPVSVIQLLPFIESFLLCIALKTSVLNDKPHPLIERGCDRRRLLPQKNVNRGRDSVTQLRVFTSGRFTTFWILTIHKSILMNAYDQFLSF